MNPIRTIRKLMQDWEASIDKDPAQFDLLDKDMTYVVLWTDTLKALDLALTGKTDCRRQDSDTRDCVRMLQGHTWQVHLSDCGYSRITIDLIDQRFGIDRSLSREPVIAAWDVLYTEDQGGAE